MLNGKDIIILKNGQAIAATKSDEIQVGCEVIPISSPATGHGLQPSQGASRGLSRWDSSLQTLGMCSPQ